MKLMGIDYGRRRIGVAVCDETGGAIRGLATIQRRPGVDTLDALCTVIEQNDVCGLVVGLALGDGERESEMSKETRAFAGALGKRAGLAVHFVDESFSSKDAARILAVRKKKARRDKALHDRIAACLILEQYLKECGDAVVR